MRQLVLSALLGVLLGCSDEPDRPPVAPPCSTCSPPGQGTGTGGGTSSEGGAPGSGEGGAAEVPSEFTVTRFEADDFAITAPYGGAAVLVGEREGGGTVEATFPGSGTVRLAPLIQEAFVLVIPSDATADALPTLLRLPDTEDDALELPLVRATVLDGIISSASVPIELLPDRAQLVLELVDATTGLGLAGATVTAPSAEFVLYSDGGFWSDIAVETDPTGLALLVNVSAAEWPGELSSVTVSGSVLGSVPYRAVASAVTVLRSRVP